MKLFISLLFVFFSLSSSFAQSGTGGDVAGITLNSKVTIDGKPAEKASVVLKDSKNKVIKKITTGADGKFTLLLPTGKELLLEVTKKGLIKKKFSFDTRNLPATDNKQGVDIKEISLFKPEKGVDYALLKQPLAHFKFDEASGAFEMDAAYTQGMIAKLEELMKNHNSAKAAK